MQAFHLRGGVLADAVEIAPRRGLARKPGIPLQPGPHTLRDVIEPGHLPWSCCFDARQRMDSTFCPVGAWPDGTAYGLEQTGPVRLAAVEVSIGVAARPGSMESDCRGCRFLDPLLI